MVRRTNELSGLNMRDKATLYWVVLVRGRRLLPVPAAAGAFLLRPDHRGHPAERTPHGRDGHLDLSGYKLYAFVLSGMGAGLAGALMVNFLRFASPDMMHWTKSGELMVMVILGGVGTLAGPFIGAGALFTLETTLAPVYRTLDAAGGDHSADCRADDTRRADRAADRASWGGGK